MRAPRGFAPTALALCVAAASMTLSGAACYSPNIKDGGFKCNLDAGANNACPEGFTCDLAVLECWKGKHDGGTRDVPVDMPQVAEVGPEVPPPPCFDARPSCDPSDAGVCDPLCQTGCGCRQKCTVFPDAGLGCGQVASNAGGPLDPCDPTAATDTCGPGLVCMTDQCFGRCYQFCRADKDCPNSFCSRNAPGGLMACDVPNADNCNPIGNSTNCPNSAPGCYISFNHPEHTLCDCAGGIFPGNPCTGSRSCLPGGLVCVDPTHDGGTSLCLPVCQLDGGSGCAGGAACIPYTGSSPSNNPNPRYGYCPSAS
jgi:hypothetical protein